MKIKNTTYCDLWDAAKADFEGNLLHPVLY